MSQPDDFADAIKRLAEVTSEEYPFAAPAREKVESKQKLRLTAFVTLKPVLLSAARLLFALWRPLLALACGVGIALGIGPRASLGALAVGLVLGSS
jgi:hypothetical protein